MADVAADEAVIEGEERRLIHSIFEFGDTVVREVMLPRPDMTAIEAEETIETAIDGRDRSRASPASPSTRTRTDNILGLVYLKDLVRRARAGEGDRPVSDAVREAVFVPEQKRVAELLREMQKEQVPHGDRRRRARRHRGARHPRRRASRRSWARSSTSTTSRRPHLEYLGDGSLRVRGRTNIDEVNEALDVELPDDEWDTVGGLVFNLLGKVPDEGETVRFQSLEFRTERVEGHRIALGA